MAPVFVSRNGFNIANNHNVYNSGRRMDNDALRLSPILGNSCRITSGIWPSSARSTPHRLGNATFPPNIHSLEQSCSWDAESLGAVLPPEGRSFDPFAMNLRKTTRSRRHRCANVRPDIREIWNHYQLASSGVSMTAAWEQAAGRRHIA